MVTDGNLTKPKYLRPNRVAMLLDISLRTVYRLVKGGKLKGHNDSPGRRGLRIAASSVEKFIEENMLQ